MTKISNETCQDPGLPILHHVPAWTCRDVDMLFIVTRIPLLLHCPLKS